MMLPEEIIHAIVTFAISKPLFIGENPLELHWKYARTSLLPLSLVNHQLRRICMPFLFAYIEVLGAKGDVERLEEQCQANEALAACIRTLDFYCYSPDHTDRLHDLFNRCTNVKQLILNRARLDLPLLDLLRRHSTLTVVLASYSLRNWDTKLTGALDPLTLPNVVIDQAKLFDEKSELELTKHLDLGSHVRSLTIQHTLLHKSFEICSEFRGLCELELWLSCIPFTLSWLPEFTSAHPSLKKIRFSNSASWDINRTVPFILPFLDAVDREGLAETIEFKAFSITRTDYLESSSTDPLDEWKVTGLWLSMKECSGRILHLAHSAFPQLRTLTLENPLPSTECASIDAEELITLLSRFTSLQTLNLLYLFHNLDSTKLEPPLKEVSCGGNALSGFRGHLQIYCPFPSSQAKVARKIESPLIDYASRMAQRIPTVQKLLVQEIFLRGWINIEGSGKSGCLRPLTNLEVNNLYSLYV